MRSRTRGEPSVSIRKKYPLEPRVHASGTRKEMLEPRTEPALSLDGRTGMESSLLAVKKECDLIKGSHSFGLLAVKV